jgi:hypothetical protein
MALILPSYIFHVLIIYLWTPPLFIEVTVPSQKSERSCISALRVLILPLSTILIFGFELFRQWSCHLVHLICDAFLYTCWHLGYCISYMYDWLLLNVKWVEFQHYIHDTNKLVYNKRCIWIRNIRLSQYQ